MTEQFSLEIMRQDIAAMIHIDRDEIGGDDNLMDLGLDSMRAMNLVLLWQERGIKLDFSELAVCPTLAGWWQVAERSAGGTREGRT